MPLGLLALVEGYFHRILIVPPEFCPAVFVTVHIPVALWRKLRPLAPVQVLELYVWRQSSFSRLQWGRLVVLDNRWEALFSSMGFRK